MNLLIFLQDLAIQVSRVILDFQLRLAVLQGPSVQFHLEYL